MKRIITLIAVAGITLPAFAQTRQVTSVDASPAKAFFATPEWQKAFMGSFGVNPGINLGWTYDDNSAILIEIEQLAGNQLSVTLTRNDGSTTNLVSTDLTAPMARVNFYNGGHDGSIQEALYVNDLEIIRGGGEEGPEIDDFDLVIVDIGGIDHVRALIPLGVGVDGVRYALEYTTDLKADPQMWIEVDAQTGNGVDNILLQDDNEDDEYRFYRVVITSGV